MEIIKFVAQKRQQTGKGPARRLRRAGKLPAVLYGRGESVAITIPESDLLQIQRSGAGENTLLDFVIEGEETETCNAILRDVQVNPLSGGPLHADFYRLDMSQPIVVTVPLTFINAPEDRLKASRAVLTIIAREIVVECLPRNIPEAITVDLEALQVGAVIHADGIALSQDVRLITDAEEAVVTTTVMAAEAPEEGAEVAEEAGERAGAPVEEETPAD